MSEILCTDCDCMCSRDGGGGDRMVDCMVKCFQRWSAKRQHRDLEGRRRDVHFFVFRGNVATGSAVAL